MKIRAIRLQNIHSLFGYHEIDFTAEPLSSAGLFAISGPTGSGKSTLLDVITLALYNRIPRYTQDKRGLSKAEIEKQGGVRTHFTDESIAEVEYQVEENVYISNWSIAKARTGNLKDYEMTLYDKNKASFLDLKKSDVPEENERIIGLSYEQFVKAIVLSQGEFAQFLKADANSRGELLEKITGAQIYRDLGIFLFEYNKEKEQEIESRKLILQSIPMPSEEEIGEIQKKISRLRKGIEELKIKLEKSRKQLSRILRYEELNHSASTYKSNLDQLHAERDKLKTGLEQLLVHKRLVKYRPLIEQFKLMKLRLNESQIKIVDITETISKGRERIQTCMEELRKVSSEPIDQFNFDKILGAFEKDIRLMDNELESQTKKGKDLRERLQRSRLKMNDERRGVFHEKMEAKEGLQLVTHLLEAIRKKMDDSQIDIFSGDLSLKLRESTERTHKLKELKQCYLLFSEKKIRSEYLTKEIEKLSLLDHKTGTEMDVLADKIKKNREEIDRHVKEENRISQEAKLDDLRKELIEGTPCPLCGSTDHPYSTHHELTELGRIQLIKNHLLADLQRQEEKSRLLIRTQADTEAKQKSYMEEQQSLLVQLSNLAKQSESLVANLNYAGSPESIEEDLALSKREEDKFLRLESLATEWNQLQELCEHYGDLIKLSSEFRKTRKLRDEKFSGDIGNWSDQLKKGFHGASNSLDLARKMEAELLTSRETILQELEKIEPQIQQLLKDFSSSGYEELLALFLTPDEEEHLEKKQIELAREESRLLGLLDKIKEEMNLLALDPDEMVQKLKLEEDLAKLNESISDMDQHLGRSESDIESANRNRRKHEKLQKEIAQMNKLREPWIRLGSYIADSKGHKFSRFAQGLTLAALVELANLQLRSLTDRYRLAVLADLEEFQVIDQYQGDISRSVNTLSGGESFLVSLALALALSDMAGQNQKIESLFIDEGFGSLDQEALELAIGTLENLQSLSNKNIGVISHVEGLKERISTQIRVEKSPRGYSTIKIVS